MPLPVIANTVRVAVRGTCPSGQRWINTIHVRKPLGPIDTTAIATIHPILVRLWTGAAFGAGSAVSVFASNLTSFDDATYTPLDGTSTSTVFNIGAVGADGANASLPSEVSFVMTLRTLLRGRSHRGRMFLPPLTRTQIATNGSIGAAVITSLVGQANGMQSALVVAGFEVVVASYKSLSATSLSAFTMDNKADVQRGRK